jgi:hypothetical protein
MKIKLRHFALAVVSALAISVQIAFAGDDPPLPPACGAVPDPPQFPCGGNYSCRTLTPCTTGPFSAQVVYCCREDGEYCSQFRSRFRCCGSTWQEVCELEMKHLGYVCHNDGMCF